MVHKLVVGASLAGLLLLGASASARSVPAQSQSGSASQEKKATKSISGKVAAIGKDGHSFSLEVTGENKKTMEFVVDRNTQVNGQVREGTAVTVEYQAMETGQNLAVTITAQA